MAPSPDTPRSSPQPIGSQPPNPASFGGLVETALQERHRVRNTPAGALASCEVDVRSLLRYAAGAVDASERSEVQGALVRSPWAAGRVSALVASSRDEEGLASSVLAAARNGGVEPARLAAKALLKQLDQPRALSALEAEDDAGVEDLAPLPRAALLLGLGRHAEAAAVFGGLDDADLPALARLARCLAGLGHDPDLALAELLDAL